MCVAVVLLAALMNSVAAAQPVIIEWRHNRLTVRAVNAPLRTLLEDVAQRTGVLIAGADRLAGSHTVDIRDAHLTDALKALLESVNFIVTFERGVFHVHIHSMARSAPPPGEPIAIPGLTDVLVASRDNRGPERADRDGNDPDEEARRREEVDELAELERAAERKAPGSLEQISTALQSDHSEVRIRAVQLMAARADEADAVQEIVSAFSDHDINVVLTASALLAAVPGPVALDAIESQLTPEAAPELKFAALRSLALRADVSTIPTVRRAAQDSDPTVRGFAESLLNALEQRAGTATKPKS